MPATWVVAVPHDDHVSSQKRLAVSVAPRVGAAGVGCRDSASPLGGVDVLLALDHVDRVAASCRLYDPRQPVQHPANTVEVPDPAATVGATLAEILWLRADDLKQNLAALVQVGVRSVTLLFA